MKKQLFEFQVHEEQGVTNTEIRRLSSELLKANEATKIAAVN